MQDRYVGDVGDFAKYALLRAVATHPPLRLAVVWCLCENESHNSDGRHVAYLGKPEFRNLDKALHDQLNIIVSAGHRSVAEVCRRGVLPPDTIYFDQSISKSGQKGRTMRKASRSSWLSDALNTTTAANVVFFDPDNGLETKSVARTASKSGKYIFWKELRPFWERGQSLIVYHHLNRTASAQVQTDALMSRFSEEFPDAKLLRPLLFRRGSCRHFWVVGQNAHATGLASKIDAMLGSGWGQHFDAA